MKKIILFLMAIANFAFAIAQFPTTVIPSANCVVFKAFANSDEGFSSSSIYSDANDVSFNWNSILGAEIESSGLATRNASLISPVYLNADSGKLTIGFSYMAPAGTVYRVRIISGIISPPLEVLASTANGPVYTVLPATSGTVCMTMADADLTVGKPIRIELTFMVVNHPGENIVLDNLAASAIDGSLPVTFTGFVARKNADETLQLLWNVAEEFNVKGYMVEASTNGISFSNIGYVAANRKSRYEMNYASHLNHTMYFRVKNIDLDGNSKYTPIIKVLAPEKESPQMEIYPSPSKDLVTIQHQKAFEKALVILFTTDGIPVLQKIVQPNTFQTQINIGSLPQGVYLLKYTDGKGKLQTKVLFKQ